MMPNTVRNPPMAPMIGHGLGSGRWYGCFSPGTCGTAAPCASLLIPNPHFSTGEAAPARSAHHRQFAREFKRSSREKAQAFSVLSFALPKKTSPTRLRMTFRRLAPTLSFGRCRVSIANRIDLARTWSRAGMTLLGGSVLLRRAPHMRAGFDQRSGLFRLFQRSEERIRQRDRLNVAGIRIRADRRIDPETQWEIHRLPRLQGLLVEAEAGCLVEVLRGLFRRDVIESDSGDGRPRFVVRGIGSEVVLAQWHGDLDLIGREGPGQAGIRIGIEPYPDRSAIAARGGGGADFGGAAISGRLTEHAIERDRGER